MRKKRSNKAGRIDVPRLEGSVRAMLEMDVTPYLPDWMRDKYQDLSVEAWEALHANLSPQMRRELARKYAARQRN